MNKFYSSSLEESFIFLNRSNNLTGLSLIYLNHDLLDSVVRGLEGVEAESLPEMVVVANLLNGVVLDVQPFQILRYEGVIEPLQAVRGDVEPLELALCRQQAVDIRYLGKIYLRLEILSGETLSL